MNGAVASRGEDGVLGCTASIPGLRVYICMYMYVRGAYNVIPC